MRTFLTVAFAAALGVTALSGATLTFPSPVTVNSTDTTSGPSFTVLSALLPTDTISLTADGTVCLQPGGTYCTNAAGVVVVGGSVGVGGSAPNGPTTFGSLLLGNVALGFQQLFATNAANGLGSGSPPTTLSLSNVTLASVGFAAGIPGGSVLQFRISDTFTSDNTGAFRVTDDSDGGAVIPEPSFAWLLAGLGIGATLLRKNR